MYSVGETVLEMVGRRDLDCRVKATARIAEVFQNGQVITESGNLYTAMGTRVDTKDRYRSITKLKFLEGK